jgi:hypothetical protein
MDINTIVGGLLLATLGYFMTYAYFQFDKPPPNMLPWVPIDVRKSKVYVSKTRDAGMYTERSRRSAIINNRPQTFNFKGFTNGVVEYYLTGILASPFLPVGPPPDPIEAIWDGGNANTNSFDIVDGGNANTEYDDVDLGNAGTNVCDI